MKSDIVCRLGLFAAIIFLSACAAANDTVPTPEPIACVELASTWANGVAVYSTRSQGFDITDCTRTDLSPGVNAEMVKPFLRDFNRWQGARCNDGTPFGFEVSLSPSGSKQEWVIFLQGGGFCDDNMRPCRYRDLNRITTPNAEDGALITMSSDAGLLSRDPEINPAFHNANFVFAPYCSSDLWTGNNAERLPTLANKEGWYFSGGPNIQATVEILVDRFGLDDSDKDTKLLFAGSSAGGFGVFANADSVVSILPRTAADGRLKLVGDANLIVKFDHPDYRTGRLDLSLGGSMEHAYDFWGAKNNTLCEEAKRKAGQHPAVCFMAGVSYPYLAGSTPNGLGLPVIVISSLTDRAYLNIHDIDQQQSEDQEAVSQWRDLVIDSVENMEWFYSFGAVPYHTTLTVERWEHDSGDQSLPLVLARFWEGAPAEHITLK